MNDAVTVPVTSPHMLAEIEGAIGWMTFNKPERRNAVSLDMWEAIPEVLRRFDGLVKYGSLTLGTDPSNRGGGGRERTHPQSSQIQLRIHRRQHQATMGQRHPGAHRRSHWPHRHGAAAERGLARGEFDQ